MTENKRYVRILDHSEKEVRIFDEHNQKNIFNIFFEGLDSAICLKGALEDTVDLLNELSLSKIRYAEIKEAHFTKMGGFSMERDGRGRYNILSENIIPKNSPVIQIKSPDAVWNSIVADIFNDLLTEEGD